MAGEEQEKPVTMEQFLGELHGFAKTAEETLVKIQADLDGNKSLFSVFHQRMIAIRGTALQLNLPQVAHIAGLGEEISIKATGAQTRPQVRRCVGALWDAITTVEFMLKHPEQKTTEEQEILVNRLEAALKSMGGARESVSAAEIEALLKQRS